MTDSQDLPTPASPPTAPAWETFPRDIVRCPECGTPAVVEWRDRAESTSGPVEHVKIRCANRHWFLMLADQLR